MSLRCSRCGTGRRDRRFCKSLAGSNRPNLCPLDQSACRCLRFPNVAVVQHPKQRQCRFTEGTGTKPICRDASSACELDTSFLPSQQLYSRVWGGKAVAHVKPVSAVCGVRKPPPAPASPRPLEAAACQVWCNRWQL